MGDPAGTAVVRRWVAAAVLISSAGCTLSPDTSRAGAAAASTSRPPPVALPAPTTTGSEAYAEGTAMRVLRGDGRFDVLVGIVEDDGIGLALPLWSLPRHDATILVPPDEAFRELDPELLGALFDERVLPRFVKNHVVPDPLRLDDLRDGQTVQTMGVELEVRVAGGTVTLGGVEVVEGDVEAGITVLHVLDGPILPCHDAYLAEMLGPRLAEHCRS